MDNRRESFIEDIEHLVEGMLSNDIHSLSDEELSLLHRVVHQVLEKERAGFDKFFESVSQTLKYIPNFIVLAITNKYIEPPIAARITAKLPMKNTLSIAKGLSSDYISETAIFLEDDYAAELLGRLPKKQSKEILQNLYANYPLRALDILAQSDESLKRLTRPARDIFEIDLTCLSPHREGMVRELKEIFST